MTGAADGVCPQCGGSRATEASGSPATPATGPEATEASGSGTGAPGSRAEASGSGPREVSGPPAVVSHKKVMFRDLLIFQLKLVLDGLKDVVLAPLSVVAFLLDVLPGRRGTGKTFYGVIRAGEKFDRWLSLYNATERADPRTDGFFGESLAGANNLIGKVEEVVRQTVEVGADTVAQARERRADAQARGREAEALRRRPKDPPE